MSNETSFGIAHPLGPLAALAALAQEWHTRGAEPGSTWAGLWRPDQQRELLDAVEAVAEPLDAVTRSRLARKWALAGVRDYSTLFALLPLEARKESCVRNTTETSYLASEDADYVTGACLRVDGGLMVGLGR